ncbi:MAG: alpha-L-fucosidase C-terminal domain-containing protein [Fusicatenibacter sp.]
MKGSHIYAACLSYPENGRVTIHSFAKTDASHLPRFCGIIDRIDVLGFEEPPQWMQDEQGLHITTTHVASDKPVVFRITLR